MKVYIAFLRGVNIAGHNKIKMTELAGILRKSGFTDAETFIQSGNIIFTIDNDLSVSDIALKIESAILKKFGYKIPALVRTTDDLIKIISLNPFLSVKGFDPARMAVLFLYSEPDDNQIDKVRDIDYPPDKFMIIGSEIYIWCPNGFAKTKLYTNFFENKMKVIGTGRNWNTINAILEIASGKISG